MYSSVLSTMRLWKHPRGFTIVELMVVVLIAGILAAVVVPSYSRYKDQVRVTQAISDIYSLQMTIETFLARNGSLPQNLAAVGEAALRDPWGNSYQYLRAVDEGNPGMGQLRKNKKLHPVNTDYDLYSMGKDGKSTSPFTAEISQDDIVRANDGAFVGLVSDY